MAQASPEIAGESLALVAVKGYGPAPPEKRRNSCAASRCRSSPCPCSLELAIVGPTVAASAAADAFVGTWTSIDKDGSHQSLFIMGSGARGRHAVFVEDDAATVACGGAPAHAQGSEGSRATSCPGPSP